MLNINKRPGETMEQLVSRTKKEYSISKLGYTARLDPMAKGIVPFVTGNLCSEIKEHLGSDKTYQVKIILGIRTDSDDPLGLITDNLPIDESIYFEKKKLITEYLSMINKTNFNQKFHHYSTKMLNHRRRKSVNVIDEHIVSIYDYMLLSEGEFDYEKWSLKIINYIKSIDQDKNFRQNKIIDQWKEFEVDKLYYLKLRIKVSSGFFIRQLIRDMSDYIKFPLMCYNINRVSID